MHTAVCQYKNLMGVTQAAAEELYISIVMQLEGYGNETFSTKVFTLNFIIHTFFFDIRILKNKFL